MNRRASAVPRAPLLPIAALWLACGGAASADDYARMLGYLAQTRIDQRAFSGASGAIAVNQAAGDLNQQANLRGVAQGRLAHAWVEAGRAGAADRAAGAAGAAGAVVAGDAFRGARGLVSINQASGTANAERNLVVATLAQQGIREAPDAWLASADLASAGPRQAGGQGGSGTAARHAVVERTALRGFEGVLQLNQIAGAGNAADNQLVISVQAGP